MALALAGCYSPSFGEGGTCTSTCPGDLVCVQNVCRNPGYVVVDDAAVDTQIEIDAGHDAPPGDADGDGIVDNDDNCASLTNADQHDEDTDTIGDVCDPCPHLSGPAVDGDGDGVGDACDPQPTLAKQRIAFFDPFTADKPEWQHSSSAVRETDRLRVMSPTGFTRLNVPTGKLRIVTGGSMTAVSTTTPHQLSLGFGFNTAGDDYYYSEFYDSSGAGGGVNIVKADSATYTNLVGSAYSGAMPTGAWAMQIDESVASQTIGLRATLGGISYGPFSAATSTPALISSSSLTLYSRNIDFRLDFMLLIETTP